MLSQELENMCRLFSRRTDTGIHLDADQCLLMAGTLLDMADRARGLESGAPVSPNPLPVSKDAKNRECNVVCYFPGVESPYGGDAA